MFTPERRMTPRFKLRNWLAFSRTVPPAQGPQETKAIDISTTGVCFATSLPMSVGEVIEVVLGIPKRVTGEPAIIRKFTGRVTSVVPATNSAGPSRIGVQLLYGEVPALIFDRKSAVSN